MSRTPQALLALVTAAAGSAVACPAHAESGDGMRARVEPALEWIATGFEVAGVGIILVGGLVSTLIFLGSGLKGPGWTEAYDRYRANLGRGILLGLEFLVAADIIGTVSVRPSVDNLMVLGIIVLIRTFLSFSLEIEIQGRWPWRRAEAQVPRSPGSREDGRGG